MWPAGARLRAVYGPHLAVFDRGSGRRISLVEGSSRRTQSGAMMAIRRRIHKAGVHWLRAPTAGASADPLARAVPAGGLPAGRSAAERDHRAGSRCRRKAYRVIAVARKRTWVVDGERQKAWRAPGAVTVVAMAMHGSASFDGCGYPGRRITGEASGRSGPARLPQFVPDLAQIRLPSGAGASGAPGQAGPADRRKI